MTINQLAKKMDEGFKRADERMDAGFAKSAARMYDIEERFDSLMALISGFADSVNARFDAVDARFGVIDARFDAIDDRFDAIDVVLEQHGSRLLGVEGRLYKIEVILEQHEVRFEGFGRQFLELSFKHDQVINSVDGLVKLITDGEVENAARDHKIQRLETLVFTNRPLPLPPL